MSIESSNIYDLLSTENEGTVLPSKPTAKGSKVENKVSTKKEADKPVELGKGRKTEDKSKKSGKGSDRSRDKPHNPNKRAYDRHSGTGRVKGEQKKAGAGKGNWGSIEPKEEFAAETQPIEPDLPAEPVEKSEETAPEVTEPAPPPEEEDKTMLYHEWKAKNEVKTLELPAPIRQAGEGVDNSAWANFVPLTRELDIPDNSKKTTEKKKKDAATTGGKVRLDEIFNIQNPDRRPRESRSRGGKRFSGPRENMRIRGGGRGRSSSKNFTLNEDAFPSLSTKA
jgi:hypothetical protein